MSTAFFGTACGKAMYAARRATRSELNSSGTATVQAIWQSLQPVQAAQSTKVGFSWTVAANLPSGLRSMPVDLAVGLRGDVRVVDRRGHLRPGDAARAVQRREDLAQQDHPSADARLLLDEQHLVAHVAELDRRLHAADAAADHQDVVVHRGSVDRARRPRASVLDEEVDVRLVRVAQVGRDAGVLDAVDQLFLGAGP